MEWNAGFGAPACMNRESQPYPTVPGAGPTGGARAELARFEGTAEEMAARIVRSLVRLAGGSGGALLGRTYEGGFEVFAAARGADDPVDWLGTLETGLEAAWSGGRTVTVQVDAGRAAVIAPLGGLGALGASGGVAAVLLETVDPLEIDAARERVELASPLVSLLEFRLMLQDVEAGFAALRTVVEVLGVVNAHERFAGAAMALVNELALRLGAARVSLGFLNGSETRVAAVSQSDRVMPASELARRIGAAMDEAVDQDRDVWTPCEPDERFISRQASELSRREGGGAVVVMPVRRGGDVQGAAAWGALVLEFAPGKAMIDGAQRRMVRGVLDLSGARLAELRERGLWVGARLALWARQALRRLGTPEHSGLKLAALGAVLVLGLAGTVRTEATAPGTFVVEASSRRVVPAPFEGVFLGARVRAGDRVVAGQVLGELDATELKLKLVEARAQVETARRQAESARATGAGTGTAGGMAEARMAEALGAEALARAELLEWQVARATLTAPMPGVVSWAEDEARSGSPVRAGDRLFEVSAQGTPRAVVWVAESDVVDIVPGQRCEMAAAGEPGERITGIVESVSPHAEQVGGRNVFRVRVELEDGAPAWLRSGMEGVAGVVTGRTSYLAKWTRGTVNWARMKLWW